MGQKKRVIPVLIGDIKMPVAENLPESLRYLARCQAVPIRHARFGDDTVHLTAALKRALRKPNIADRISSRFGALLQNRTAGRFAIVIIVLAIAASAAVLYSGPGPAPQTSLPLQPVDSREVPTVSSRPDWCLHPNLKPDERRICASQALWKLDNEEAALYLTASKMAAPDKRAALRDEQNIWMRDTRGGCQDENCLEAKYRERIAYFNKLTSN
jgi:uncharacterized protein YecT (DUF1311 family)